MKKLEYKTTKTLICVYVDGKLWKTWERNETNEAIADGRISPPSDLNEALQRMVRPLTPPPELTQAGREAWLNGGDCSSEQVINSTCVPS